MQPEQFADALESVAASEHQHGLMWGVIGGALGGVALLAILATTMGDTSESTSMPQPAQQGASGSRIASGVFE